MRTKFRSWAAATGAALALVTMPGLVVTIGSAGVANADVCASAGRRISVSGCANLSDVMAPYVPPPDYYAPLPEDFVPPPPPPPPPVSGCIGVNGRRVSVSGCR